MKKHWKPICAILLLPAVVGGCAWYARHAELRETLEALRFRRIPLGRLWNCFDRQGGEISYSPYRGILGISDGVHYLTLNYQDDWEYIAIDKDSGRSAFYNVSLSGGEEATQALTDYLLTAAKPQA